MNSKELERQIINDGFLYDHLEFRISEEGTKTVFIIFGGSNCSGKIADLRRKLISDDIRVVQTKMEPFMYLFSKLPRWDDSEKA